MVGADDFDGAVGPVEPGDGAVSEKMRLLFRYAGRIAAGDAKVLITGESGVGKNVVARHIHAKSARRNREYVEVNCAGIPDSRLEHELFGGDTGNSGTGAHGAVTGTLQRAHRGTLFLDEPSELSPRMQALLLRFLDTGEIHSAGLEPSRTVVNVRVIAATSRNLPEMVAAGTFRDDLLYRLRVVHLHVPSLRERPEDVQAIGASYLARSGREVELTEAAWAVLTQYPWPGNVRELQNVMEQLIWMSSGGPRRLDVEDLPLGIRASGTPTGAPPERRRQIADVLYDALVEGRYSFWSDVHPLFVNRDITRHDLRELVRRGLRASSGSYRRVLDMFSIPPADYKRFMRLLAAHDCRPDIRELRRRRLPETALPAHGPGTITESRESAESAVTAAPGQPASTLEG